MCLFAHWSQLPNRNTGQPAPKPAAAAAAAAAAAQQAGSPTTRMALLRSLSLDLPEAEANGGGELPPANILEQEQAGAGAGEDAGRPCIKGGPLVHEEPATALLAQPEPAVEEQEVGPYLPDECVKLIQAHLVAGESLGAALLHLLNMAAVCRQWRHLASELAPGAAIAFDCFENAFPSQPGVQRFRKLNSAHKEQVFAGAARLLTGRLSLHCTACGAWQLELRRRRVAQGMALKFIACPVAHVFLVARCYCSRSPPQATPRSRCQATASPTVCCRSWQPRTARSWCGARFHRPVASRTRGCAPWPPPHANCKSWSCRAWRSRALVRGRARLTVAQ